ncbi:MAG: glutamate-5-semialdehyde dehydrogenase [Bacteroidota bacterium]
METKTVTQSIIPMLAEARAAAKAVAVLTEEKKNAILTDVSAILRARKEDILKANELDLARMDDENPKKDRLRLTDARIEGLVNSTLAVADLPKPDGQVLKEDIRPNGLKIQKISVPLGVVGVIYEARPNVTIDVVTLCLRSGNGVVLRGGSDAYHSNLCLVGLIHEVLQQHGLNQHAVTLLPTERALVKELLSADQYVDILIPRGSRQLIDFVRENATIPTIETGAGVCHTYVSKYGKLKDAAEIVVNAKVSRPSVCNALDTILVDRSVAESFLPLITEGMAAYQVEIFADAEAHQILSSAGYGSLVMAEEDDFGREFLDFKCSVKVVENIEEALLHIDKFSSKHSEAIVSEEETEITLFLQTVDAAAVYANASTRFTDGEVFGLGAEIGISTQKLHARGPFALEKLVTEKWVVRGNGQIR